MYNKLMVHPDASNDKLYDLLDRIRVELKADISNSNNSAMTEIRGLRSDFTTLERGRLTLLEGKMNDFEIAQANRDSKIKESQAVLSTKFLIIGTIAVIILTEIVRDLGAKLIAASIK